MSQNCGDCRFFQNGQCRRSPPARLPRKFEVEATAGNRVRNEAISWGWPEVESTDWCGQHETVDQDFIQLAADLRKLDQVIRLGAPDVMFAHHVIERTLTALASQESGVTKP